MAKVYSVDGGKSNTLNTSTQTVLIDLSPKLKIALLLILGVFFWSKQLFSVLLFLMLSFVIMCTLKPIVKWFIKKGVSKGWAAFLSYLSILVCLTALLTIIIVPFVNQVGAMVDVLPKWIPEGLDYVRNIQFGKEVIDFSAIEKSLMDWIKTLPNPDNFKSLTSTLGNFFSSFAIVLSSIVMSIYLLSEHESLVNIILIRITDDETRERVVKLISDVESKLGGWVLGQGTVSLLAMIFTAIVLSLFKVPFAIPLSVFVGLVNAVPAVGTTLGGVIVGLVALLSTNFASAAIIVVLMIIYQQVENNFITPRVMGNVMGLKPLYVMAGVVIMLLLAGPVGALIAVPFMVLVKIAYEFYIDLQKLKAKGIV